MTDLPHLGWPVRFNANPDGTTTLAVCQQDTDQHRKARAAVVVCTPKGHRDDDPRFGVTDLVGQQGDLNLERLAGEIVASDPELDVTADETVDLAAATVRAVRVGV